MNKLVITTVAIMLCLVSSTLKSSPGPLNEFRAQLDSITSAMQQEDYESISITLKEIELDSSIGAYHKALFYTQVGQLYQEAGNHKLAIEAYKLALPLKKKLSEQGIFPAFHNMTLHLIAANYLHIDKPKLACKYRRQLTIEQKSAPDWRSFIFLAHCEYMQGNYQESLAEAEVAKTLSLKQSANDGELQALWMQAKIYEKLGRNREAVTVLSKIYDAKPTETLKARINRVRENYSELK